MILNQRTTTIATLLVLAPLALTACSSAFTESGMYEGTRWGKINECNQLPEGQRDVCLEHVTDEYEDYKREREKLKEEDRED